MGSEKMSKVKGVLVAATLGSRKLDDILDNSGISAKEKQEIIECVKQYQGFLMNAFTTFEMSPKQLGVAIKALASAHETISTMFDAGLEDIFLKQKEQLSLREVILSILDEDDEEEEEPCDCVEHTIKVYHRGENDVITGINYDGHDLTQAEYESAKFQQIAKESGLAKEIAKGGWTVKIEGSSLDWLN